MASPELQYHAGALRILSVEPPFDSAEARIEAAEGACGRRLPAAVREWYRLVGAEELLTPDDNTCGVAYLNDFLNDLVRGRPKIEFYGSRRVNTGFQAYVVMDGPDDPPVQVDGEAEHLAFSQFVARLARYAATGVYE